MSETQPNQPISYSVEQEVALITMNDGKVNALSHESIDALNQALDRAEEEALSIVLAGSPGRFCGGFDLKVMTSGPEPMRELVAKGAELLLRVYLCKRPLIIACTGHAMAAGAVMLLAADHCIGAEGEFKIGLNEVAIGMPLPIFAVELARSRLSARDFTAATCGAQIYDPVGAVEVGYLHQLCPPEQVIAMAQAVAKKLGKALAPAAFHRTKLQARTALARHVHDTLTDDLASFTIDTPRRS